MARLMFAVILLAFVCFISTRASPMPQDVKEDGTKFEDKVVGAWNNVKDAMGKSWDEVVNSEKLNELFESGKDILQKAGDAIRKETEKITASSA